MSANHTWMTTADVARTLGVTSTFVRQEMQAGRLGGRACVRPGKRTVYRISRADLDRYMGAHWRPPTSAHVSPRQE